MGYEAPFACLKNGPGEEPLASGCMVMDFERDNDVDLGDDPGTQTR